MLLLEKKTSNIILNHKLKLSFLISNVKTSNYFLLFPLWDNSADDDNDDDKMKSNDTQTKFGWEVCAFQNVLPCQLVYKLKDISPLRR